MLSTRTIIGVIVISVFLAGCTLPDFLGGEAANADAIAVWQHKADSWDIWYSIWDHDAKTWYVPGGGASAPISVDEGDDHDPDVSSNEDKAIAVWAKSNTGIYYSQWENFAWSEPATLSDNGDDSDPTVAVDPSGNALAVWVTDGNSLSYSYYKEGIGWTSDETLYTASKVSLPEVTYSASDGVYYLVFTGTDDAGNNNAYGAAYATATGWSAPMVLGNDALLDNNMPTDQRTGASAAESMTEATLVWPGANNDVYSIIFGGTALDFSDGEMPDVCYDSAESAHGAYSDDEDLYHMDNVNSPGSELTISSLKERDDRASLTFIRDREIGLVVWWTEVIPPGQIYYSYYENGQWFGVAQIDSTLHASTDRNPAVTPLRSAIEMPPEEGYCGDKVLQAPPEQCEIGIPCPNPKDVCIIPPCVCLPPPPKNDSVTCFDNTAAVIFGGMPLFWPGMVCKDDCVAQLGKEWQCDMKICECIKKQPKDVSCATNTQGVVVGLPSQFKPGMTCTDDCKQLGPDYMCDAATCICDRLAQGDLNCAHNTELVFSGQASQFLPGTVCIDNCAAVYGDTYYCDMDECLCDQDPIEDDFYCAGNTFTAGIAGANTYNPITDVCIDNCDALGDDLFCNFIDCVCEPEEAEEASCAGRDMESILSSNFGGPGPVPFNPLTMVCIDDCADTLYCDFGACECEPRESQYCTEGMSEDIIPDIGEIAPELVGLELTGPVDLTRSGPGDAGAGGTVETEIVSMDLLGVAPFGPISVSPTGSVDSFFDVFVEIDLPSDTGYPADSFFDIFFEIEIPGEPPVSSPDSFFDVFFEIELPTLSFSPSTMICKDNCDVLGPEFECEMEACKCEYKPKEDFSCYDNTGSSIIPQFDDAGNLVTGNNFNPAVHQCRDDCSRATELVGGEWECNLETCECESKPTKCAENTFDFVASGTSSYSWLFGQCVDNCEELGEGYQCDPFACVCRKEISDTVYCDANTIDAYVTDTYGRAQSTRFDPSSQVCIDNCENFRSNSVCDMKSCYCVPDDEAQVSCAVHTDHVSVTDVNEFNPSTMQCFDDCEENWGSGYVCNMQSCTCTKSTVEKLPCSTRIAGTSGTVSAIGKECVDDCAETLGSDYYCNIESCMCYQVTGPPTLVSCTDNIEAGLSKESLDNLYGPDGWQCSDDCERITDGTYYCDTTSCSCIEIVIEGVCGDGVIGYGEECDYGSSATNTCSQAGATEGFPLYCTEGCECKQIEHSPRCGDGKITPPEGCDGGNVNTNICPEGYTCYTPECVCQPLEGTGDCGDGTVVPPEECDHGNTYTEQCPGSLICSSCACVEWDEISHRECDLEIGACVSVPGPGEDSCYSDSQCEEEIDEYCGDGVISGWEQCEVDADCDQGLECIQCQCVEEMGYCGDGVISDWEECEIDGDCPEEGQFCYGCMCYEAEAYCGDGNVDSGEQCDPQAYPSGCDYSGVCGSGCRCVYPPTVNCDSICAEMPGTTNFGGGYSSAQTCSAGVGDYYGITNCYTTCAYAGYYKTTNIAGSASCCCGMEKMFSCDDCPGQNPVCPDPEVICTENEPSWYS